MTHINASEKSDKIRPFTINYVLRQTLKYVYKAIDFSIEKTMKRIPEFADDQSKSDEVFKTLTMLQGLKSTISNFEQANAQYFQE